MCWLNKAKGKTIEEIVAEKSVGMTDFQKAEYWYEINQSIFALLGKIEVNIYPMSPIDWIYVATQQYPTLTDIKIPDGTFYGTDEAGGQRILSLDWTNLIPFVADIWDCDKYAVNLYDHLCLYYKITNWLPIWGDTDGGYHGFTLPAFKTTTGWVAKLIEPQTDAVFIEQGPLGKYVPRKTAEELGIKKLPIASNKEEPHG